MRKVSTFMTVIYVYIGQESGGGVNYFHLKSFFFFFFF